MPGIFAGDTKALVFPVMCDGYIKLDYSGGDTSKNEPETELALRGGFWGHQGDFSIEAVITPYDVNGYGTNSSGGLDVGVVNSEKTPPILNNDVSSTTTKNKYQSYKYWSSSSSSRYNHKFMLFYNSNFKFYLENTTFSNSYNQPAKYKIVVEVNGSTISSEDVITASDTLYGYYDVDGQYKGITTSKSKIDDVTRISNNVLELSDANNMSKVNKDMEIFDSSGTSYGPITNVDTSNSRITTNAQTPSGITSIYKSQPKEALYIEGIYKIGCSYANGVVGLYINGNLIKEQKTSGTFSFDPSDSFIGQDGTNKTTQFMGELYEICMYKRTTPTETSSTLSPGYNDILFYYRFGE